MKVRLVCPDEIAMITNDLSTMTGFPQYEPTAAVTQSLQHNIHALQHPADLLNMTTSDLSSRRSMGTRPHTMQSAQYLSNNGTSKHGALVIGVRVIWQVLVANVAGLAHLCCLRTHTRTLSGWVAGYPG